MPDTVLVDDFRQREQEYAEVKRFGTLHRLMNRMAVFTRRPNLDTNACREAAKAYRRDFR